MNIIIAFDHRYTSIVALCLLCSHTRLHQSRLFHVCCDRQVVWRGGGDQGVGMAAVTLAQGETACICCAVVPLRGLLRAGQFSSIEHACTCTCVHD